MEKSEIDNVLKYPVVAIMTKQDYTLTERRLIYAAMMQIKQGRGIQGNLYDKGFTLIVPYSMFKETNWARFKENVKKLENRKLTFLDTDTEYESMNLTQTVVAKKDKTVSIHFTSPFTRILAELGAKGGFAQLEFQAAMVLSSEYAQRMYELLSRWKDTGVWFNQDVSKVRELLNVPESYSQSNFKGKVLDLAQKQLKEYTDITFTYELDVLKGRTFQKITFIIKTKNKVAKAEQSQIDKLSEDDKNALCIQRLKEYGIVREDLVLDIVTNKRAEFFKWNKEWKQTSPKMKKTVRNPAGLLLQTLGVNK